MIISRRFWRSRFGPGPSAGGCARVPNGLAGPAIRNPKNVPHVSHVPIAYAMYSTCSFFVSHVAPAMYTPRTKPQKRIEPSSDDQRLTIVTHVGTERDPTCAT